VVATNRRLNLAPKSPFTPLTGATVPVGPAPGQATLRQGPIQTFLDRFLGCGRKYSTPIFASRPSDVLGSGRGSRNDGRFDRLNLHPRFYKSLFQTTENRCNFKVSSTARKSSSKSGFPCEAGI